MDPKDHHLKVQCFVSNWETVYNYNSQLVTGNLVYSDLYFNIFLFWETLIIISWIYFENATLNWFKFYTKRIIMLRGEFTSSLWMVHKSIYVRHTNPKNYFLRSLWLFFLLKVKMIWKWPVHSKAIRGW